MFAAFRSVSLFVLPVVDYVASFVDSLLLLYAVRLLITFVCVVVHLVCSFVTFVRFVLPFCLFV
jgi:hypothetical protein